MNPKNFFFILSCSLFSTLQAAQFNQESLVTDPLLGGKEVTRDSLAEKMPSKATYFMPRRWITDGKAPAEFLEKYNPANLLRRIPMKEDKYAAPEMLEAFAAEHEKNLNLLMDPLSGKKDISFSWIFHLAHLNNFSDIYRLDKAEMVKTILRRLLQNELLSQRYVDQYALVHDIHYQLGTGLRSEWSKSSSRESLKNSLERHFATLEGFAKDWIGLVKAIKFVLERMETYEINSA